MKTIVVLITGIGTTTALSVIKGFRKQKEYEVKIVGVDASSFVAGKYFVDKFYKIPPAKYAQKFKREVTEIILKEKVDLVIPIVDYEFPLWGDLKNKIQTKKTRVLIASSEALKICTNKYESVCFLNNLGIPTIKAYNSLLEIKKFPLFIKPKNFGRSSIDAYKVKNRTELNMLIRKLKGNYVLQDFIKGQEYTADCLSDFEGKFICCVIRQRVETKSGISIKGEIVEDPRAFNYCKKIVDALKIPGVCNIQFFKNKNNYYFFDINPRFAGAHAFTLNAGLNTAKHLLDMLNGKSVRPTDITIKYGIKIIRFWDEIIIDDGKAHKVNLLNIK